MYYSFLLCSKNTADFSECQYLSCWKSGFCFPFVVGMKCKEFYLIKLISYALWLQMHVGKAEVLCNHWIIFDTLLRTTLFLIVKAGIVGFCWWGSCKSHSQLPRKQNDLWKRNQSIYIESEWRDLYWVDKVQKSNTKQKCKNDEWWK